MQPPFPTKKFFLVLLFLVLAAGGIFKLFSFLNNRTVPSTPEEQKLAVIQNEVLSLQGDAAVTPAMKQRVATSTLNAVAAVVYLNEQTKANGATMEEITSSVAKQVQAMQDRLDADTYTKNDILIGNDNSPEALKKYGNDMAEIFAKYGKDKQPLSYLEIIKKALETNDPKIIKGLDPYISFEKNVIKDALALKAPPAVAVAHLHIINASAEMLLLFQSFATIFSEVPAAIASNSRLEKSAHRLLDSFKELGGVFNRSGVVFSSKEAGIIFTNAASLVN